MARIPESELERIKRDVSLVDLVRSSGVTLERKGKDYVGLCLFHPDKNPSLVVTPEKNLWHCLGACNEGGSVIDWVMKRDNISFRHAVEILKSSNNKIAATPLAAKQESCLEAGTDNPELLNQVIDYYHHTLKDSPDALAYLKKRKLIHPELLERFKLGFGNRTLGYRLPDKALKTGAAIRGQLQEIGILRESGHEHFAGSLVIPVIDENGQVREVYGRKISGDSKLRKGTPLHLYLKGQHKGVFNIGALQACKEIILCEALIDALTFWCHGFFNVTASYGVNGFTCDHLAAFKAYGTERVYIAYDTDEAGDKAALSLVPVLNEAGIECLRVKFPTGKDASEFAQQSTHPQKGFAQVIHNAELLGISRRPQASITKPLAALPHDLPAAAALGRLSAVAEIKKEEILFTLGERKWRVRGFFKNLSYEQMKVNVLVSADDMFFVDSLDMYSARLRNMFIKQAATELKLSEEIIKSDLGKVFLQLEELQDEQIKKTLEPKKKEIILSQAEQEEALNFLKDPRLLERILEDFEKCGVVGEETNKLVGYLAAISRKLDTPLAILIQSSSSAGKTWLMDSILAFMPEEERVKYSAMTGQSLFYLGETDLKNKILALVEEEGTERASYALKLLQSEGELSIASTGKDPQTGKLVTHEYRVQGPVMIFTTTTSIDIDEELQNRCIVLTVNETREQTRAIHKLQRERRTFEGLQARMEKAAILKLHSNAQRLLRPLKVINLYARHLTFLDDRTRTRRDHEKYLNLIETIAILHQYQRPLCNKPMGGCGPVEYIEVQLSDIETANKLAGEVLGRSLDELPPQTRRLLELIHGMISEICKRRSIEQADCHFSRRQICDYVKWGMTQVRVHLDRLIEQEYVLVHRGDRGHCFVYELLYQGEGQTGKPFLTGLINVERLKKSKYDDQVAGLIPQVAGSKRGQNGLVAGGVRGAETSLEPLNLQALEEKTMKSGEKKHIRAGEKNGNRSHTPGDDEFHWPAFSSVLEFQCFYAILAAKVKEFEEEEAQRNDKKILLPIDAQASAAMQSGIGRA